DYDVVLVLGSKTLPLPVAIASGFTHKRWFVKFESPAELWEPISEASLAQIARPVAALLSGAWRRVRQFALRRADGYIAISAEIAESLSSLKLDKSKTRAIPNGVDTYVYRP